MFIVISIIHVKMLSMCNLNSNKCLFTLQVISKNYSVVHLKLSSSEVTTTLKSGKYCLWYLLHLSQTQLLLNNTVIGFIWLCQLVFVPLIQAGHLGRENTFIRLARRQICGSIFLIIDLCERAQSTVDSATPGQVYLVCMKKQTEKAM